LLSNTGLFKKRSWRVPWSSSLLVASFWRGKKKSRERKKKIRKQPETAETSTRVESQGDENATPRVRAEGRGSTSPTARALRVKGEEKNVEWHRRTVTSGTWRMRAHLTGYRYLNGRGKEAKAYPIVRVLVSHSGRNHITRGEEENHAKRRDASRKFLGRIAQSESRTNGRGTRDRQRQNRRDGVMNKEKSRKKRGWKEGRSWGEIKGGKKKGAAKRLPLEDFPFYPKGKKVKRKGKEKAMSLGRGRWNVCLKEKKSKICGKRPGTENEDKEREGRKRREDYVGNQSTCNCMVKKGP